MNDVTVEIIELAKGPAAVEVKVAAVPDEARRKAPARQGTLKRVWRKLTGSTKA